MGSLSLISGRLAHLEPIGFDQRDTMEFAASALTGQPVIQGPLTLEMHRRVELVRAAEDAREAQEKLANDAKEQARQRAARIARVRDHITNSGAKLTDEMWDVMLSSEGPTHTAMATAVLDWMSDKQAKPWLVLSGSTGRGKTIAALLALAVEGGTFARARELARAFTARFGEDQAFQELCFKTRLLIVDDVGRESDHALMSGYLEDLLDERPNRQCRTIITTNLDAKQFAATYGDERLRSRLSQLAKFVSDVGPDMRRQTKGDK
jgi:DNA replication protein DnaC